MQLFSYAKECSIAQESRCVKSAFDVLSSVAVAGPFDLFETSRRLELLFLLAPSALPLLPSLILPFATILPAASATAAEFASFCDLDNSNRSFFYLLLVIVDVVSSSSAFYISFWHLLRRSTVSISRQTTNHSHFILPRSLRVDAV